MGPIDYSINVKSPFESALQGFQGGLAIQQAMDARAQQQAQRQAAVQMQRDLGAFSEKTERTAADYAGIVAKYPQLSEHFKRGWEMESPDLRAAKVTELSNVFAAMHSGSPEVAADLLSKKAEAARNSGDKRAADSADAMVRLIKLNPEGAKTAIGLGLYAATGDDKFAETLAKLGGERRAEAKLPGELAEQGAKVEGTRAATQKTLLDVEKLTAELPFVAPKARAELQNTMSQIADRAGRLALDRDRLMSEMQLKLTELNQKAGEIPDDARKTIGEATAGAVAAQQTAGQMLDLAGRLEGAGGGYGAVSTASEWLKKATGNQDAVSAMRQEYTRLRNTAAIKSLPPGPATDKDIELALQGFPPPTADAKSMASFLRGVAKMQQLDATTGEAKAEWVAAVKHMGRAPRDIEVLGVKVPAGTTFVDFSRRIVEQRSRNQSTLSTIQASPYAQFATPPTQQQPEPQ